MNYSEATAEISECGLYRWTLTRSWVDLTGSGTVAFVMLNPSTADGTQDDPTIRRCVGFAKAWGFTRLRVVNLFPFRCTEPKGLLAAADPTGGAMGDRAVRKCLSAEFVVAAWGAWVPFGRAEIVTRLLSSSRRLHCIGKTKDGHPRHPLYVKSDASPEYYP